MIYSFTVIIKDHTTATEEMADRVYEAGGDDASVCSCDGIAMIHFDRESNALTDAIRSACKIVVDAGYEVGKLEISEKDLQPLVES